METGTNVVTHSHSVLCSCAKCVRLVFTTTLPPHRGCIDMCTKPAPANTEICRKRGKYTNWRQFQLFQNRLDKRISRLAPSLPSQTQLNTTTVPGDSDLYHQHHGQPLQLKPPIHLWTACLHRDPTWRDRKNMFHTTPRSSQWDINPLSTYCGATVLTISHLS